jgi:DNA primase
MNNLIIDNHVIKKDIKSILEELRKICVPGKLKSITVDSENVKITCPVHKDGMENSPSCNIYIGDSDKVTWGTAHCFACSFNGQLFDFISESCDKSVEWSKRWLKTYFTESIIDKEKLNIDQAISIIKNKIKKEHFIDNSYLDKFQNWHPYLSKRKISREICEKFEVRYDPKSECVIFPVRDIRGNLKFFTRRSVNSKKFIIDKNIDKDIYLLYNVLKDKIKEVYVVESQINALTLWSWGYPAIALLGTGTQYQYDILNKCNILSYKLCFDGDEAGYKGTQNFIKNVKNCFISIVNIPKGKDVNDLSKEEFKKLNVKEL